ncbi:MAG: hypothetical protein J7K40_10745 [candidate division Zixibacteria bacterium]|nr:hypothetical protein [candidate division Zixibacteria bacterium]
MNSTITTNDFYLAAFLITKQKPLTGHVRENNKSTFLFEGIGINELANDYYQGNTSVLPLAYGQAIRNLKTMMYNNTNIQPTNNDDNTAAAKESK